MVLFLNLTLIYLTISYSKYNSSTDYNANQLAKCHTPEVCFVITALIHT